MTTIISAVVIGVGVLLAGSLPGSGIPGVGGLAGLNLRWGTDVPWAILPMAVYLWAYWKFIGGSWGRVETRAFRRENLRARALPSGLWSAALCAGLLGFAALFAFIIVMARLVTLPASAAIATPEGMPFVTLFLLLVMASIVAGVTEEAAFRGYMQGPVERRYGLASAVLVNGTMFGLLHFANHPSAVLTMLPYYVAVSAVYGGLTWAADSILPALVLHAGGDVWSLTRLWQTGRPEWQMSTSPPAVIWQTGVDASFILSVLALVALAALTTWAYVGVRRLRIESGERSPGTAYADV